MPHLRANELIQSLRQQATPEKAQILSRFFKTGKGEYGEGDHFLGVTVPMIRHTLKSFRDLPLGDILFLLKSEWHEIRLAALLLMVTQYQKADADLKDKLYAAYLNHWPYINNWDLIDLSAEHIVGAHLYALSKEPLIDMSASENLWQRRISILSTFYYIKRGEPEVTLRIAELLLRDKEDLIHKATGWMLREVGKRCSQHIEEVFLQRHARIMPRTMLRYAIERFPEPLRKKYLEMK
ncbi:MAG: DNA alkylation repair protein [Candidatus Margulisiibacteriota bacterium]